MVPAAATALTSLRLTTQGSCWVGIKI